MGLVGWVAEWVFGVLNLYVKYVISSADNVFFLQFGNDFQYGLLARWKVTRIGGPRGPGGSQVVR